MGKENNGKEGRIVHLRGVFDSKAFRDSPSPLTVALGKDTDGNHVVCRLEKMPHLLIAGVMESEISTCLHAMIISLLHKATPEDVRLILADSEYGTFHAYRGMPHLWEGGVLKGDRQILDALDWTCEEMERRYGLFMAHGVRNFSDFNESDAVKDGTEQKLPYIVIIVDELAEYMLDIDCRGAFEEKIVRLTQKARAAGIHLVLATRRPTVDVITGMIKANIFSSIAFAVDCAVDSRVISGEDGAEMLLGKGDMLYYPSGANDPIHVQGAYVTEREIIAVTDFLRDTD